MRRGWMNIKKGIRDRSGAYAELGLRPVSVIKGRMRIG